MLQKPIKMALLNLGARTVGVTGPGKSIVVAQWNSNPGTYASVLHSANGFPEYAAMRDYGLGVSGLAASVVAFRKRS